MPSTSQLTFTRFLAAVVIVVFHFGTGIFPFNHSLVAPLFTNVGISFFFVLSGFVMVIAYTKLGQPIVYKQYWFNRLARIYPTYLFALLGSCWVLSYCHIPFKMSALGLNLALLQSWIPPNALTINRAGWTLSVEAFFYLSFPFINNYCLLRFSFKQVAIAVGAFWLFCQCFFVYLQLLPQWPFGMQSYRHDWLHYFPPMHFNQFLVGNLFGLVYLQRHSQWVRQLDAWLLAIIVCMTVVLELAIPMVNYHNGFMAPLFGVFILLMSLNTGFITELCNKPWAIYLGEISFAMYILQIPLHYAWYKLTKPLYYQNASLFFASYITALLLLSVVTFHGIEKPMRSFLKRHLG